MHGAESLRTIAEVSVGLVGFAGVAGALRRTYFTDWSARERQAFWVTMGGFTAAGFFSLLPAAVAEFSASEKHTWSLCCGLFGVFYLAVIFLGLTRNRRLTLGGLPPPRPIAWKIIPPIGLVTSVWLVLGSLNVLFQANFGMYYVALLVSLMASTFAFVGFLAWPTSSDRTE